MSQLTALLMCYTTIIITIAAYLKQLFVIQLTTFSLALNFIRQILTTFEHATCLNTVLSALLLLLLIALFSFFIVSLAKVPEVESSCSRLQEEFTATVCICAFSCMSFPHPYFCWFIVRCIIIVFVRVFIRVYLCIHCLCCICCFYL